MKKKILKTAKIFGYILGDGWIDKNGGCGASGDEKSLYILIKDINDLWGKNSCGEVRTRQTYSPKYNIYGTSSQFIIHANVTKKLLSLGMPQGRRTEQSYNIPKWILQGDYDIKTNFISGYYAAEGLIPSLQTNRKTPRPLSFCFSKNILFEDSAFNLSQQFQKILNDIGLNVSISHFNEITKTEMIKYTITINNSEEDFVKALKLLNLDYCLDKEIRRKQLLTYFNLKEIERQKITSLKEAVIKERQLNKTTYIKLAAMFHLTKSQIENIFNGKQKCKVLKNFPKFDQNFINTYCSIKTPLNDENLIL